LQRINLSLCFHSIFKSVMALLAFALFFLSLVPAQARRQQPVARPKALIFHPNSTTSSSDSPKYSSIERIALFFALAIAVAGLIYPPCWRASTACRPGTPRMQQIAAAVRSGADAYLKRQLTSVAAMIVVS